ncbi:hypothetical protein M569_09686, partial [Genlisea aurea]
SLLRTRGKKSALLCGFLFVFIAITLFLAFAPSADSSSPWFSNVFALNSTAFSDDSYRSRFSSVFTYFFPNSTSVGADGTARPLSARNASLLNSTTDTSPRSNGAPSDVTIVNNRTQPSAGDALKKQNETANSASQVKNSSTINSDGNGMAADNNAGYNFTPPTVKEEQKRDGILDSLKNCDMYDGSWVRDESYPLYRPGSCSLIDEQFNCFLNGRPDHDYYMLKWKPKGCTLPRLNGSHMLELLRGKRLVLVGDSLNRNMWESLICILKNSVKDQTKVYEQFGRYHFRTEASYSFVFEEYKCTVEFFVAPFLVQEWEVADKNGTKKETLRLDMISHTADEYKTADIVVFNTGHWWTHEKTSLGKDYYQEGSHVYGELNVLEAFRRALTHWGRWIDSNMNPTKSLLFFRGYSASHFSGGQWNSGGQCHHETEPIKNETYLVPYPQKMLVLEKVLKGMRTHVTYLNLTRMTDYRKDGHPSIYRKLKITGNEDAVQDCSHWCLPGVPDSWNEILYAQLILKLNHQVQ